jgi:ribosomal protein L9
MYLLSNGFTGTADEKVSELMQERDNWKKKFKDLNRELMCELRDPNGTIWEHAASLQKQVDNALRLLGSVMDEDVARKIINEK